MNILYAVSEAFPFAKDGGLGDVAYAFPQTVRNMGQDIRVVMPLYDTIPTHYREQMELISNFTLNVSFQTLYCGLYRLELRGVTVYFVENDVYFMRDSSMAAGMMMHGLPSSARLWWNPFVIWTGRLMWYTATTGRQRWCCFTSGTSR